MYPLRTKICKRENPKGCHKWIKTIIKKYIGLQGRSVGCSTNMHFVHYLQL